MADDIVFEWDEAKRRANIAKHGIDFTLMALFEWGTAMIIPDDRHDEKRSIAICLKNFQDRPYMRDPSGSNILVRAKKWILRLNVLLIWNT